MDATTYFRPGRSVERLESGPTLRPPRPPRSPRRSTPTPAGGYRAALLYRLETSPYLANLGNSDKEYRLEAECQPTTDGTAVHPVLFLCPPQVRYTAHNQCEAILQSRFMDGRKDLHTGLRTVAVPQQAVPWVSSLFVADYKSDYRAKVLGPAAVLLFGRATATAPGWLLLLVTSQNYKPKHRLSNERTALSTLRAVLPTLPEWLGLLPTDAA